jgi:hypothetical protein
MVAGLINLTGKIKIALERDQHQTLVMESQTAVAFKESLFPSFFKVFK